MLFAQKTKRYVVLLLLVLAAMLFAVPALAESPSDYNKNVPQLLQEGHLHAESAVLIDAENVVASLADEIFRQAEEMGTVVAREIFGTASALTTWVAPVLKYAMHPNLTIKAAKGKNSSDIALVIGAMDQLMHGEVDTFIIASSDSDFSSLSVRLRNAGKEVVGMGTDKSNDLWRTACTRFVVLGQKAAAPAAPAPTRAQNRASQPPGPIRSPPSRPSRLQCRACGRTQGRSWQPCCPAWRPACTTPPPPPHCARTPSRAAPPRRPASHRARR